jgi:endonuclease/exonuclease/phosphatase family metal-dependent hydrolase
LQVTDPVRIISYNIHKGIGGRDRLYRIERVLEVIRALEPDVVCLQEVDHNVARSRYDDQPKLLAEKLDLSTAVYQLNVHLKTGGYGNLVLSRFNVLEKHHISLRLREKKPRGAQLVVLDTPQGPLHAVNWHLGLSERERAWQVGHLMGHDLFRQGMHLPTVIIGDYNDWRNQLKHAHLAVHGFEQVTHPASRFRSFPAFLPLGSLDKAFVRGVNVERAYIAHSPMARQASDHLPLVVDFDIAPPTNGHAH